MLRQLILILLISLRKIKTYLQDQIIHRGNSLSFPYSTRFPLLLAYIWKQMTARFAILRIQPMLIIIKCGLLQILMDFQIFQFHLKASWKYSKCTSNDLKLSTSRFFMLTGSIHNYFQTFLFFSFTLSFLFVLTEIWHLKNCFIYLFGRSSERLHRFIEYTYRKSPKNSCPLSTHNHKDQVRYCANSFYGLSPDKWNISAMSICYQRSIVRPVCTAIWYIDVCRDVECFLNFIVSKFSMWKICHNLTSSRRFHLSWR